MAAVITFYDGRNGGVGERRRVKWAHLRDGCLVYQLEDADLTVMYRPIGTITTEFAITDPAPHPDAVKAPESP